VSNDKTSLGLTIKSSVLSFMESMATCSLLSENPPYNDLNGTFVDSAQELDLVVPFKKVVWSMHS
jgi:hypothetical protein